MGRLFVDSDILIKAAHWELLDDIPRFCGSQWDEISTNASLFFRARRGDAKLFKTPKAAIELLCRLTLAAELPSFEQNVLSDLQGVVGIDAGEALLVSSLCADPTATLLTGDKRALRALGSPGLEMIRRCIRGRVFCLEQFLLHVLNDRGPAYIIDRIQPFRSLDTAVYCILGSTRQPSEISLQFALASYLNDLRSDCNGLLGP